MPTHRLLPSIFTKLAALADSAAGLWLWVAEKLTHLAWRWR